MESCCPDVQRIVHLVNTQRTVDVWLEAEGADRVALERAVELGGGRIVEAGGANAIVWAAGGNERIRRLLRPGVEWVQVWDAGFDDWWATARRDFDDVRAASFYRYQALAIRDPYQVDFDRITDE